MRQGTKADLLNLPNTLSLIRLLTAPVLVVLLFSPGERLSVIAGAVFLLACLTDWLDGYFARKMGIVTSFGKFLDPLADKLLIITVFIMLIPLGRIPAWMVALIVCRAIAVTGLRAVATDMGVVISASPLGKYKTIMQIACLVPLIIHYPFFGIDFQFIGTVLLVIAFILTMVSGADYFRSFFKTNSLKNG
jgi:CDP-diacylglycerol--glycerol-3-phosphate 3-phosphatidyltransferase